MAQSNEGACRENERCEMRASICARPVMLNFIAVRREIFFFVAAMYIGFWASVIYACIWSALRLKERAGINLSSGRVNLMPY